MRVTVLTSLSGATMRCQLGGSRAGKTQDCSRQLIVRLAVSLVVEHGGPERERSERARGSSCSCTRMETHPRRGRSMATARADKPHTV